MLSVRAQDFWCGLAKAPVGVRLACLFLACVLAAPDLFTFASYAVQGYVSFGYRQVRAMSLGYVLWAALFYTGSRFSTPVFWLIAWYGFGVLEKYALPSFYVFVFLLLVPVVVFSAGWQNLVNLLVVLAAAFIVQHRLAPLGGEPWVFMVFALVFFWGLPVFLRALMERYRREQEARELERERLRRVAEEQNVELARELHDGIARHLSVLTLQAHRGLASSGIEEKDRVLELLAGESRAALDDLRRIVRILREDRDIALVPQFSASQVDVAVELERLWGEIEDAGVVLTRRCEVVFAQVPLSMRATLVYTLRELALNMVKYAGAGQSALFEVKRSGGSVLVRTVNPLGALPGQPGLGVGLVGVKERVTALGGRFEVSSAGGEWAVSVLIPVFSGEVDSL